MNVSASAGPGVDGAAASLIDRFEGIYGESGGDPKRIPWAHERACPWLVTWLDVEAPGLVRPGSRAAVVGCGLGNDAALLHERGYDVRAFDVCGTAVELAKRRHPQMAGSFFVADLMDLPGSLEHRFDLVVEVHTLQSLPPTSREGLARGMARLLSHRGVLVAIARGRACSVGVEGLEGPPFPLTRGELEGVMGSAGLEAVRGVDEFMDENDPPVRRLRGAFRRSG